MKKTSRLLFLIASFCPLLAHAYTSSWPSAYSSNDFLYVQDKVNVAPYAQLQGMFGTIPSLGAGLSIRRPISDNRLWEIDLRASGLPTSFGMTQLSFSHIYTFYRQQLYMRYGAGGLVYIIKDFTDKVSWALCPFLPASIGYKNFRGVFIDGGVDLGFNFFAKPYVFPMPNLRMGISF